MKIRVLEVLASLRRAGAERVAVSLACGLDRARFDAEVVSLYDAFPDGFEPVLDGRAVPCRHLGKKPGFDPRMYRRMRKIVAEFAPHIVHTHSYVLRYTLACGAPHMAHTVHNVARKEVDWVGRMIHRVAFRRGVAAVAVSDRVADSLRCVYGRDPAAVIPNGVDLAGFGAPSDWRSRNNFRDDDLLVVSVARLEPQKNPLGLLDAFAAALKDTRTHLLLAGDGTLRQPARQHAERLGIAGRVHFLGLRTDIPELLAASDIFVLAADWEGSPMAVIEAMASGLPVVATSVGGVPELVQHGRTGLLVPPRDSTVFAAALASLAAAPDLRRQFGRCARERAAQFDLARMIAGYSELFERLARGSV